jgi:SAM-dependent methyltransferase
MVNLTDPNYFSRAGLEKSLISLGMKLSRKQTLVDLGCGRKPYKKYFQCKYIGVDNDPGSQAEVIAPAWNTTLINNSADAVLLIQSLEHIKRTSELTKEVYRILKPGGLVFVSVPQTMPNHGPIGKDGIQEDYFRFTPGGLSTVFNKFKTVYILRSCGYWSTIFQLINYYLHTISPGKLFLPFYLINNILGISLDFLVNFLQSIMSIFGRKYYLVDALTLNYLYLGKK